MQCTTESPKIKRCPRCGTDFPASKNTKYCCAECAQAATGQAMVDAYADVNVYTCQYCGKQYKAKRKDRSTFCCRKHAYAWRKEHKEERRQQLEKNKKPLPKCKECGADCPTRQHVFCCNECQREWYKASLNEENRQNHYAMREPRKCIICGQEFAREYKDSRRKFCSDECRDEAKRRQRKKQKRKYGSTFNQRGKGLVKKYWGDDWELHYQRINRDKVLKRDGMRCQICGIKIKKTRTFKDWQASVDHIVPLSMGGDHSYANVQACCMKCNSEKSDTAFGQLRLMP